MVEQILRETIAKFNRKVDEDPKLAEELRGIRKTVQVEVTDGEWYHFVLENSKVSELVKGAGQNPDVRIIASADTLKKLYSGELRPMKAYVTKQVQIKGSIEDLLRLRKFF
jgi:putative sterol carrier protein